MSFHDWLYNISRDVWPFAANHLWQTTLVCGLAMVALVFLNRKSARARYAVWVILSLKFALPSAVLVALFGLNGVKVNSFTAQAGPFQDSDPTGIGFFGIADLPTNEQPGQIHSEIYCLLTVVWLAGFVLVLTSWLRKRVEFSRLLRSSRVVATDRESAALRRVTSWLRTRSDIELIVSPEIVEPGVWRVFRPAIVLPENISAQLSDPELESLLMHEVIHIQRRDNLVASLQMILCSIFWFHPLIWIIDKKMLSDREQACDQEVCLLSAQSAVYAASLLKVLRFCIGFRMAGVSSAAGSNLKRRIDEIMFSEVEKRSSALQRAFVVIVAMGVMVFSITAGVMSRDRIFPEQGSNNQAGVKSQRGAGGAPVGNSGIAGDGTWRFEFEDRSENDVDEELKNAAEISLPFDNDDDQPPVVITEARMKAVKARSVYRKQGNDLVFWADQYAINTTVTLINNSSQRAKRVSLVFSCEKAGPVGRPPANVLIEPGATVQITETEWTGLGDPSSFSVRVGKVLFEGGDVWPKFRSAGTDADATPLLPPPPPPPPAPARRRPLN